jgi:hypothetical protein
MTTMLSLLVAALLGADDPGQTYEFVKKGSGPPESRTVYGRIIEDRGNEYYIEVDAPWEGPKPRRIPLRDEMLEAGPLEETPQMREARIDEGWEARGFRKVVLTTGETAYVRKEEKDLAERARRAALEAEPDRRPRVPPEALAALEQPAPEAQPEEAPEKAATPWWAKRGAQAILALVALLLVAVATKTLVFSDA